MKNRLPRLLAATVLGTLVAAGCSDDSVTGVRPAETPARVASTTETCEVINFNNFTHGQAITSLSVLGMTLSVTTTPYALPAGEGTNPYTAPRAFDTDQDPASWEDKDLLWKAGGHCPNCNGLGRIMVIEDERGFPWWGDARYGGEITISGFSGSGLYVKSFKAVDDDGVEPTIRLAVGTDTVARSSNLGNGSVETVLTSPHTIGSSILFAFGTKQQDRVLGSGGVDDIMICRRQEEEQTGGEGCTLGYWKQQHHFDSWQGYTQAQWLNTVFDFNGGAAAFAELGDDSLLQALSYNGGSNALAAARLLLKQAVAGLLNAASTDVDYALTAAQIVSQVNAAMDTGSRSTMLDLAGRLDGFNNAGCPLN